MPVKILVATPIKLFGELIRTTLTSHGEYSVTLRETADQALDALIGDVFDVVILDSSLSDQPFVPLVQKIVASLPDQKIAIIPPENRPDHPLLENVSAHGFLFRPFRDPDLINLVQRLASAAEEDRRSHSEGLRSQHLDLQNEASWMEDPARAANELARSLLGSSALAALIIHRGDLWIHSGRISEEASREINQMLSQVKTDKEKDLVRFTFLVADDCEALVYAVQLIAGWTLALVYDVSMPLTRVRSQASTFASHLRENMRLENLVDQTEEIAKNTVVDAPQGEQPASLSEPADAGADAATKIPPEVEANPSAETISPADAGGEVQPDEILPAEPEAESRADGEDVIEDEMDVISLDEDLIALINEVNHPNASDEQPIDASQTESQGVDHIYAEAKAGDHASPDTAAEAGEIQEAGLAPDQAEPAAKTEGEPTPSPVAPEMAAPVEQLDPAQTVEQAPAETASDPAPFKAAGPAVEETDLSFEASAWEAELQALGMSDVKPQEPPAGKISVGPALEETDLSHEASSWEDELNALEMGADEPAEQPAEIKAAGPAVEEIDLSSQASDWENELKGLEETENQPEPLPIDIKAVGPAVEEADLSFEALAWEQELKALEAVEATRIPSPSIEQIQVEPVYKPPLTEVPPEKQPLIFQRMEEDSANRQAYTLVFTPRRPGQFLTGPLASFLGDMLKKAAASFPWKLTGVAIRPEYLRLSIEISDYLEPSDIIHFIKEFTDSAISNKFPQAEGEQDGISFWAEDHLVVPDYSTPDGVQLREFLQSVRSKAPSPA